MTEVTMNENCGVYKIVNLVNGKCYVGSSICIAKRATDHFCKLKRGGHANAYLQAAYNKYGRINFKFEIIEYCDSAVLVEREDHWIDTLNAHKSKGGYNIKTGAARTPPENVYKLRLQETIEKARETRKKNKFGFGEECNLARLTAKRVNEIRTLVRHGYSYIQIARATNEHRTTVRKIAVGESWAHLQYEQMDVSYINVPKLKKSVSLNGGLVPILMEKEVIEIRELVAGGESTANVAEKFGASIDAVRSIVNGRTWKHVGGPLTQRYKLRNPSAEQVNKVIEMHRSGFNKVEISTKVDLSWHMVTKIVNSIPGNTPVSQAA